MRSINLLLFLLICCIYSGLAQDEPKEDVNEPLRKHGLEQSQVMEIASWLTDVYGPRLTGSPQLDRATDWAVKELKKWGMENVHTESWGPFGRGWELEHFQMSATVPTPFPIIAYPKAWSPSIKKGPAKGKVIYLDAANEEELEKYKGKLKGNFVFIDTLRVVTEWFDPMASRRDDEKLLQLANAPMPKPRNNRRYYGRNRGFGKVLWEFIYNENPIAVVTRGYKGDLGTVFVSSARAREGRSWDQNAEVLPQVTMSVEHYNRIFRLLKKGMEVELRMELEANYTNPDGIEHNIIAEIPGTDLKDEIVMFGAHFDSWHAGTGATDNAAGSAVMMEAARILQEMIKESGVKPRRTLRLALWTGEEQGLLGSRAYVADHLAAVDGNRNITALKPMQEKISAYYNLDNGTGKIRGVFLQGNLQVMPIFRKWLDAFKDLDATTLSVANTGGTDHLAFDYVGVPGFQFIQDPIAYFERTHHSNMDNLDHLVEEDMKQAATIIASFVFHTAQRDEMLPRKAAPEIVKNEKKEDALEKSGERK